MMSSGPVGMGNPVKASNARWKASIVHSLLSYARAGLALTDIR